MDLFYIGLIAVVGFCVFMAGRASVGKKQELQLYNTSPRTVLSESALVNNPLQETPFRIESEHDLDLPVSHPHHNHILYVLTFDSDLQYILHTVVLPARIQVVDFDSHSRIPSEKYRFKLNQFGRIVAIVPEDLFEEENPLALAN